MSLDAATGARLILRAQEAERDERLFQQWTAQLPIMAMQGKPVSFDDYKEKVLGSHIDLRPASVILAELDEVEKQFTQEGGERNGS